MEFNEDEKILTSISDISQPQNINARADGKGWNSSPKDSECQNRSNILEKVSFVQIVAGFKNDGR